MQKIVAAALCALLWSGCARAQSAQVLSGGCGTAGYSNVKGAAATTQDTTGAGCINGAGGTFPTVPGSLTPVPLDVATVTTGGTAVTALIAGHRTRGGWLQNPAGATVNLCINEQGAATGTTSAGNTTCVSPGQAYSISPGSGAVSVVTSDSSHPFSGMGFN